MTLKKELLHFNKEYFGFTLLIKGTTFYVMLFGCSLNKEFWYGSLNQVMHLYSFFGILFY
jgi:hypothetical protein